MCTYHFFKKKNVEWICGNDIAEIGEKKLFKLVCGNAITEIEERDIKKVRILFFQYFFD